jgi:hypothetical protein
MANKDTIARKARELLSDETFRLILNDLKNRTLKDWANTAPGEQTKREEHWRDLQAVARLETHLQALVDGAKLDLRKADAAARKPS